jgi:hypothetical protein
MILRTMLQRLYAGLASGPSLNAKPHSSRQRIDLLELRHLQSMDPGGILRALLANGGNAVEISAKVPVFQAPDLPENEWSPEQKKAKADYERQNRLLGKLRDIAGDAADYYNDYGEHALYIGYPLLSLPATNDKQGMLSNRVLAPMAFTPISLTVRRSAKAGITIEAAAGGADLVQPNPALLAWIEQQTGTNTDTLFADEAGEDPWRELSEILTLLGKATDLPPETAFNAETVLNLVPRTEDLPTKPAILPGAVLGLFPLGNPCLMRDTKWMIEQEKSLGNPVKPFLSPEALLPEDDAHPEAKEWDHTNEEAAPPKDFANELLVAAADPCQAEAVGHARRSAALVIHGPPGTGKSQTIANVIGDHLARGERVLFVCDKRTALDVVKFRLDSMGLGILCGVIHDPQRDRKDLFLGLRDRLENMTQEAIFENPDRDLAAVNRRLNSLHAELKGYFQRLHAATPEERSFHELCGKWLGYRDQAPAELDGVAGMTPELLREHRTDCEEVATRAISARWPVNPYRDRLNATLSGWLATRPEKVHAALAAVQATSDALDGAIDPLLPALDLNRSTVDQVTYLEKLAAQLTAVAIPGLDESSAILTRDANWRRWREELAGLEKEGPSLDHALERAFFLQVKEKLPSLHEAEKHLLALDEWIKIHATFFRHFAFAKKNAATLALEPISAGWDIDALNRARTFYAGIKARHLWTDLFAQLLAKEFIGVAPDDQLRTLRDGLPKILATLETSAQFPDSELTRRVLHSLMQPSRNAGTLAEHCRLLAARAKLVGVLEAQLQTSALFSVDAITGISALARGQNPVGPLCASFVEFTPTLDDSIRLIDRLNQLPPALATALKAVTVHGLDWKGAEPTLLASSLALQMQQRLGQDQSLAIVDTRRVESLFSELLERNEAKINLVRQKALSTWQSRWRSRLLGGGPLPRLNSLASNLRQRLFVKGQKSMKLRQMIAAGAQTPDGDPLFDLCPVWMASPGTVSQIFSRDRLFDVVVFDEASQCRLEEALPVLLRAKRVVIAGDPKQLPPTRFFEKALAESDNTGAETPEEVFVTQQSEAEDLLTAALNLNVQEAFLDVHYRSRDEGLIGFSNGAFYGSRLQPIPGHPRNKALQAPIHLTNVDGVYFERGNEKEAAAAADLVGELLAEDNPPSIGLACFNLNQRDLILEALDAKAEADSVFAERLGVARKRRGRDSFEGLFVKNLENVQGDERDHIIISTTFGLNPEGKFNRNFGALSRAGGERRLNVLVTRARAKIHVLTSIPKSHYRALEDVAPGATLNGRQQLYAYLRYAELLQANFEKWQDKIDAAKAGETDAKCGLAETSRPSAFAESLGEHLKTQHQVSSTVYWGNDGFCVDVALTHPVMPYDVTVGVLTDFTRYLRTPDPIAWEQFRSRVLKSQGWQLHRLWSPGMFRNPDTEVATIRELHAKASVPVKNPATEAVE